MKLFLRKLRAVLAATIVLAIPAYAISSMATGGASGPVNVTLADRDDPIQNGLSVVHRSVRTESKVETTFDLVPQAVMLIDWGFTGKSQPSPYG